MLLIISDDFSTIWVLFGTTELIIISISFGSISPILNKDFIESAISNSDLLSLGVDTFENDPISFFKLKSDDYFDVGRIISNLNLPTLFVMEGGYSIDEIGINTVNILKGFEE